MSLSFARRVGRVLRGIRPDFSRLSPASGQVTYVLLSRLPLSFPGEPGRTVRLACIRRTASVRPEPGSNSMKLLVSFHYPVVKVPAARTPCSREYHPLGRPPAAKSMISDITRKGQALSAHSPQSTGLQARRHPLHSCHSERAKRSRGIYGVRPASRTRSCEHGPNAVAPACHSRIRRNQPGCRLATTPLHSCHSERAKRSRGIYGVRPASRTRSCEHGPNAVAPACHSRIRRNQPGCRLATTPLTYSTLLRSWCIWSPAVPPSMAR